MRLNKKRIFLIFIISLLVLGGVKTRYINKFREGFYFEKYSTAEDVKAGLLELHPIGSDVGELTVALDEAGAQCEHTINSKKKGIILCYYSERILLGLWSMWWRVVIDLYEESKLKELTVISSVI